MAVGLRKRRRIQLVVVGAVLLAAATGAGRLRHARRHRVLPQPEPARRRSRRAPASASASAAWSRRARWCATAARCASRSPTAAPALPVVFAGIPPDLFREGQGVVATGRIEGGTFVASEILAKHDERYMPKEVADALKAQGMFHPDAATPQKPGS